MPQLEAVSDKIRAALNARNAARDETLILSREIIRAHQGDLVLESSANGWTVFRLNLPLA